MNEQQKKAAEQALSDHVIGGFRIADIKRVEFFRNYANHFDGWFVIVCNLPSGFHFTVLMVETEDGWHIENIPWNHSRE